MMLVVSMTSPPQDPLPPSFPRTSELALWVLVGVEGGECGWLTKVQVAWTGSGKRRVNENRDVDDNDDDSLNTSASLSPAQSGIASTSVQQRTTSFHLLKGLDPVSDSVRAIRSFATGNQQN